jgi:lipoprotein signal peptidase
MGKASDKLNRVPNRLKTVFLENVKNKKLLTVFLIELAVIGLIILIDELTKIFIYQPIADGLRGDIIIIPGVLRLTSVENTGASFGVFSEHTEALAAVSCISAVILIVVMFFALKIKSLWFRGALVGIVAGGLGNFIDRVMLGYVRDFVYFELIDFAVFNVADSALTIGTIMLLIYIIFIYKEPKKPKEAAE